MVTFYSVLLSPDLSLVLLVLYVGTSKTLLTARDYFCDTPTKQASAKKNKKFLSDFVNKNKHAGSCEPR